MTQDSNKANQDGPENATENAPEKVSDKALDHASDKKPPAPKTSQAAKVSKPADRASVAKTKPVVRTIGTQNDDCKSSPRSVSSNDILSAVFLSVSLTKNVMALLFLFNFA